MSNGEISFYVDTLLVETVLGDPKFYKKAGFLSDVLSRAKEYFGSKFNAETPAASVLNELAPGALWFTFQALGIGKWGLLLGLLMNVFHVDAYGILRSLFDKIKGTISSGKKTSSAEIDAAAQEAVQENSGDVSPQQVQQGFQTLQNTPPQEADDGRVYSSLELMPDAKIIRLALNQYEDQNLRLTKTALNFEDFFGSYKGNRAKGSSLLGKIFGWVMKIALASAGLMIAGDVINKVLGRPNSFDGSYKPGQEPTNTPATSDTGVTQNKYPLKGDAPLPSSIPLVNNPENIESLIIQFAKDVYSGLDGKEQLIRNTAGFQAVKERIAWANVYNPGSRSIIMPPNFTSKKKLVDYFIDDVAKADV